MNYYFFPSITFNNFQPIFQNRYQFSFYPINLMGQMSFFDNFNLFNDNQKSVHQLTENIQHNQVEKNQHTKDEENQEANSKQNLNIFRELKDCCKQNNRARNIHSNILKRFFKQLCQNRSMDSFIQTNFNQGQRQLDTQLIIEKIKDLFISKNKTYFSPKSILHTLNSLKNYDQLRKIFTVCLCKFLKEWFIQILLFSPRIKRNSKLLQMKKSRQLLSFFKGQRLQEQKYKINPNQDSV